MTNDDINNFVTDIEDSTKRGYLRKGLAMLSSAGFIYALFNLNDVSTGLVGLSCLMMAAGLSYKVHQEEHYRSMQIMRFKRKMLYPPTDGTAPRP